jgi:hypothetical protein
MSLLKLWFIRNLVLVSYSICIRQGSSNLSGSQSALTCLCVCARARLGLREFNTCCMENDVYRFVTKLTPTPSIKVRGVGNQPMTAKGRGTVLWKIEYDKRVVHDKLFPGALYISDLKLCFVVTTVLVPMGKRSLYETRWKLVVSDG